LRKSETSKRKKIFFEAEAKKLKKYEVILKKVNHILTISPFEHNYFKKKFGDKTTYIPVFYDAKFGEFETPKNKFTLWHGDLRVADNSKAALFLIRTFSESENKLVIASSFSSNAVLKKISKYDNITYKNLENDQQLESLYKTAHIHTLVTYQKTGIKLKLINVLCKGKFVIASSKMIEDTGLEETCYLANTQKEFNKIIDKLLQKEFDSNNLEKRFSLLKDFNPVHSAEKIIALL